MKSLRYASAEVSANSWALFVFVLWIKAIQMRGKHTTRAKRTVPNAIANLIQMTIFDYGGCAAA
jgi:hypothetical protein